MPAGVLRPVLPAPVEVEEHPRSRSDLTHAVIRPSGCFMGTWGAVLFRGFTSPSPERRGGSGGEDEHATTTRRLHHRALHGPAGAAPSGAAAENRARLGRP